MSCKDANDLLTVFEIQQELLDDFNIRLNRLVQAIERETHNGLRRKKNGS